MYVLSRSITHNTTFMPVIIILNMFKNGPLSLNLLTCLIISRNLIRHGDELGGLSSLLMIDLRMGEII